MGLIKFVAILTAFVHFQASHAAITCPYRPGATIEDDQIRATCCDEAEKQFSNTWFNSGSYLSTYLAVIKSWKCPQYESECANKTYAFTDFAKLLYQRECAPDVLYEKCLEPVFILAAGHDNIEETVAMSDTTTSLGWSDVTRGLDSSKYSIDDLLQPCMQVAMYDSHRGGYRRFHEIIQPYIPFCGFLWCGFDADTLHSRDISAWTCMPKRCKANILVAMTIIAIFALLTILGNLTIITVFTKNRHLRNSQAFYKVTLAIGDTIVGGVVYPTFIYTFYLLIVTPESMGNIIKYTNDSLPLYSASSDTSKKFSHLYYKGVGFCTSFSLFVSVYSLTAASFDRLSAIMRPLAYNKGNAQFWAMVFCIIILTIGVMFAAVPLFTTNLEYDLVAFVLVALAGDKALITYSVTFLIPLLTLWLTTVVILVYSRKHAKIRRSMSNRRDTFEKRLAITLAIMVIVFSVVVLPGVIVMMASLQARNVFLKRPKELDQQSTSTYQSLEFISVLFLTSNSLWNIFIYSSMQIEFRRAVKQLYTGLFKTMSFHFIRKRSSLNRKPRSRRIVDRRKPHVSTSKTTSSYLTSSSAAKTLRKNSTVTPESEVTKTNLNHYGGTMESILEAVEGEK